MNTQYQECRSADDFVNARETYCSVDGKSMLYWCAKDSRWKGACVIHRKNVLAGNSVCYISAPIGSDILSPTLLKGWHEFFGKQWVFRAHAGVSDISCQALEEALTSIASKEGPQEAVADVSQRAEMIRVLSAAFGNDEQAKQESHRAHSRTGQDEELPAAVQPSDEDAPQVSPHVDGCSADDTEEHLARQELFRTNGFHHADANGWPASEQPPRAPELSGEGVTGQCASALPVCDDGGDGAELPESQHSTRVPTSGAYDHWPWSPMEDEPL